MDNATTVRVNQGSVQTFNHNMIGMETASPTVPVTNTGDVLVDGSSGRVMENSQSARLPLAMTNPADSVARATTSNHAATRNLRGLMSAIAIAGVVAGTIGCGGFVAAIALRSSPGAAAALTAIGVGYGMAAIGFTYRWSAGRKLTPDAV